MSVDFGSIYCYKCYCIAVNYNTKEDEIIMTDKDITEYWTPNQTFNNCHDVANFYSNIIKNKMSI